MDVLNRSALMLLTLILTGCSSGLVEFRVRPDGRIDKRRVMARDEIAVPKNSGNYAVKVGASTVTYHLPRPLSFGVSPAPVAVLRPTEVREVFTAYYEKTGWPTGNARYEVAAAVTRLENPSAATDPGSESAVLKAIRSQKNLRSLADEQSIRSEVLAGNRWTVFRGYDDHDRSLLDRIIFARLVDGGQHLILFRLNFWSEAKGREWRAARMQLIEQIVKSVTFSTVK